MAIAREQLAARFRTRSGGEPLFDYRTWVLASDGDLMEGVASEAASLAGHLRLGSLKVLYDSNRITIDGSTDLAFTEQVDRRFAAYGWNVFEVADGNDLVALGAAMAAAETREWPAHPRSSCAPTSASAARTSRTAPSPTVRRSAPKRPG